MTFRKILCPVDFSEASAAAARYAAALAGQNAAELTLLHAAAPLIDFEFALTTPNQERLAEFARHREEIIRHALEEFPGEPLEIAARREVRQGDAAEEIVRAATEGGYDLILMPTHGAGAIRRWMLVGSVTMKVLHAAQCPVIASTDFCDILPRFRRILCALDLGPASRRVLCGAAGMAKASGASLEVVHAIPDSDGAAHEGVEQARRAIADLQRETGAEGGVTIEAGTPHSVISSVAERTGASLLVIGRGVHTDLLGRLRAQAHEIIRDSPCPVLNL